MPTPPQRSAKPSTGVDGTSVTLANPAGGNIAAAVTYDEATRTATLNPTANLAANTRYTVTLANTIGDANGNKLAATTWSFTTAGVAPTVTGRTPAANAVNVAVGTNATATFSEAVTGVGVGTMTLTNPAGATIPAAVTYANGTATLNPTANLATNTRYTVKLTNGIRGTDGTPLAATEWSFTTAAPVVDPAPTVTGRTPASNETNVNVSGNITATFSEPVTGVSLTTMRLTSSNGAGVLATVSYNATTRTATLNPLLNLAAGTRYTVSLTNGIRDNGGNALAATSWSFTTDAAPTVSGRAPAANATNVARGGNVTVTFNEPVTGVSGTSVRLTTGLLGLTNVSATVSYNATTRTATLNPNATLAAGTRYTVRLSNGIMDAGGNRLAATTWSFTTDAAPTVARLTPGSNATNISRSGNVTVQFSEAVSGVSGTSVKLVSSTGSTVSAVVSYKASTRTATINPKSTLKPTPVTR